MQREHKEGVDLVTKSITLHLRHTLWYISLQFFFVCSFFSRLTEEVNKRGKIFLPLFKFGSWQ